MPDANYNIVVQQDVRAVVVQTPGPKGVPGNTGTGMSSISVSADTGSTGAIAGNASISIVGDGNKVATSASGSVITITDSGLRTLAVSGDSGTTSLIEGAGTLTIGTGGGLTSAASGTTVTITHDAPGTGLAANNFVESITLDQFGHVQGVVTSSDAADFRNTTGSNDAGNLNQGSIPDARVPSSAVTQHQSSINIAGSQVTSGTVPVARIPSLPTSQVTSGTFADARISEASVTQHAAAIDIGDLGNVTTSLIQNNAVLKYNSSTSNWTSANIAFVDDTTPQLGGNLDLNGNSIVSVGGADVVIEPSSLGNIVLDGLNWPTSDGSASQFLKTDGAANLSFATLPVQRDWKFDPDNAGVCKVFDDFLGADGSSPMPRFVSLAPVQGGSWNNAFATDTMGETGTDLYGLAEAETSTATHARTVMNLPRLMSNSPSNGDEWLWEVRVKPQLATGDGYFMIGVVRPDGVGNIDFNDKLGVTDADDEPRAWIYADKDNTYWKSGYSNSTASATITAADTAAAYSDNAFVRLAVHCKYNTTGTKYDIAFYIDGVSRFTTSLTAGQGSPYGRIELVNNGTGSQQRALFDWTIAQYTRHTTPTYIDIASI